MQIAVLGAMVDGETVALRIGDALAAALGSISRVGDDLNRFAAFHASVWLDSLWTLRCIYHLGSLDKGIADVDSSGSRRNEAQDQSFPVNVILLKQCVCEQGNQGEH